MVLLLLLLLPIMSRQERRAQRQTWAFKSRLPLLFPQAVYLLGAHARCLPPPTLAAMWRISTSQASSSAPCTSFSRTDSAACRVQAATGRRVRSGKVVESVDQDTWSVETLHKAAGVGDDKQMMHNADYDGHEDLAVSE